MIDFVSNHKHYEPNIIIFCQTPAQNIISWSYSHCCLPVITFFFEKCPSSCWLFVPMSYFVHLLLQYHTYKYMVLVVFTLLVVDDVTDAVAVAVAVADADADADALRYCCWCSELLVLVLMPVLCVVVAGAGAVRCCYNGSFNKFRYLCFDSCCEYLMLLSISFVGDVSHYTVTPADWPAYTPCWSFCIFSCCCVSPLELFMLL